MKTFGLAERLSASQGGPFGIDSYCCYYVVIRSAVRTAVSSTSFCLFFNYALQPLRLIVRSGLDVPTFATRRHHACHHTRAPSCGRWSCGREMSRQFCLNADLHVTLRDLSHAVKLRHGTDGLTSPPKEGVLRIFFVLKIRRLRPGANPRTWVPPKPLPSEVNSLNAELNPICYLLALLAHHFIHVSRIRVKSLTIRLLMSYIYGAPILDVSRSHTTTQHSR